MTINCYMRMSHLFSNYVVFTTETCHH